MWYTIVTVIHVITCFFLATVVLLQQGKGSDVSAVFGGSSQTLFGSSGAGNLLTKLTSASAIIFMLTSLTLTYGAARQSAQSLFDSLPASTPPLPATQEHVPAQPPSASTEGQAPATGTPAESTPAPQPEATSEGQPSSATPATSAPVATAPTPAPATPAAPATAAEAPQTAAPAEKSASATAPAAAHTPVPAEKSHDAAPHSSTTKATKKK
jgi:preprotein translocase subunit SecG